MGDLGIESDESYGFDMNNKGEVIGQSLVYLSYKNDIYKQLHATKWINGKAIDLHKLLPKSTKSCGIAINDLGEVLSNVPEVGVCLIRGDQGITVFNAQLNKLNNLGYAYNYNFDYGRPIPDNSIRSLIYDRNKKEIFVQELSIQQPLNHPDSIWVNFNKIIKVNDKGEAIATGETLYGETHAMLLKPIIKTDR